MIFYVNPTFGPSMHGDGSTGGCWVKCGAMVNTPITPMLAPFNPDTGGRGNDFSLPVGGARRRFEAGAGIELGSDYAQHS